ncbi:MAG: hypothetical protein ABR548_15095 [Actinomycetota bacterium]|nr:hypothetical protein [Actinomycetota bacterium]
MADASERFLNAISALEAVADEVTPDDAHSTFDDATLQEFWRDWPHVSSWAGSLWRLLSQDLEMPAKPVGDHELDETGAAG